MADTIKKTLIKQALTEAKKQGKTYNQMYEDEFKASVKKGELNSDAIKNYRAYERYSPKEVRQEVDSWTPEENTRAQYEHEKAAGGAGTESFKKWKDM